jgi:hypothetical protein
MWIAHRPVAPLAAALAARRAAAVFTLASALGAFGCVDEPKPNCISTVAPFAVKLVERSRTGACETFGPDGFNADPEVGLSPFYLRNEKGQPDYSHGSLAIQTAELGTLFYAAEGADVPNSAADGALYSRGDFSTSRPDADDFCTVPTLSRTHLVLAEIPAVADDPATVDEDESAPGQPAVDVSLDWSDVRVYVTAASYGTQMDADLVDTRITPAGDSCAITYKAVGLAPAVSCAATDEDGAPLTNPDGSPQLDPDACNSEADPAAGRVTGSGISPNAAFSCDPVTAFCMIDGETIPALR